MFFESIGFKIKVFHVQFMVFLLVIWHTTCTNVVFQAKTLVHYYFLYFQGMAGGFAGYDGAFNSRNMTRDNKTDTELALRAYQWQSTESPRNNRYSKNVCQWSRHYRLIKVTHPSTYIVIDNDYTLPTDQTIHDRSLSKVCCDGFTCGIRNTCNNQHNILLWITI